MGFWLHSSWERHLTAVTVAWLQACNRNALRQQLATTNSEASASIHICKCSSKTGDRKIKTAGIVDIFQLAVKIDDQGSQKIWKFVKSRQ